MKNVLIELLSVVAGVLAIASQNPVSAQITRDGSTSWSDQGEPGTFDAGGSDKLVVVVTIEHHFGPGNLTGNVNGITYNGDATFTVDASPEAKFYRIEE